MQKTAMNHWSQSWPQHPVTKLEEGLSSLFQGYEINRKKHSATFRSLPQFQTFCRQSSQRRLQAILAKTDSPSEKCIGFLFGYLTILDHT